MRTRLETSDRTRSQLNWGAAVAALIATAPALALAQSTDTVAVTNACEKAFASGVKKQDVSGPVKLLMWRGHRYGNPGWNSWGVFPREANPKLIQDSSAVVCIRQTEAVEGRYVGVGVAVPLEALRTNWDVRVITMPSGQGVAQNTFSRGPLPTARFVGQEMPERELFKWLATIIQRQ